MDIEKVEEQQPELNLPVESDGTWKSPATTTADVLRRTYDGDIADAVAQETALQEQEQRNAALLEQQQATDQGFLPDNPVELVKETAKAAYGGATDAIESVGSTLDLAGDTVKTMLHNARGIPLSAEEGNVGLEGYKPEPVRYLDVPRRFEVENESGLGNLARGMVEFGLLIKGTAMTGGMLAPGLLGSGTRAVALNRLIGSKLVKGASASKFAPLRGFAKSGPGTRFIKFLPTMGRIAGEGSVADLISSSSDYANLANLVHDHVPWFPFAEWLSVDPDVDNPYTARLKTVLAGGGANLVFAGLLGFARGRWASVKARKDGKSIDEANQIGNIVKDETIKQEIRNEIETRKTLADQDIEDGKGISSDARKDWVLKHLPSDQRDVYTYLTEGNLPDTRGNSLYFHATRTGKPLPGDYPYITVGENRWHDENVFGDGFYTTDDLTVAFKDREPTKGLVHKLDETGKTRVVYETKEIAPVQFFDADERWAWDDTTNPEVEIFKKISVYDYNLDEIVPLWPTSGDISYAEIVDRIKDSTIYPREEVTPLLNNIDVSLRELGYGGLTYKSSISGRDHNVKVYWEPETQLEINRLDTGDFGLGGGGPDAPTDGSGPRMAKIQELEDLADANANAAGDPWIDELGTNVENSLKESKPTPDRNPNKFTESEKTVLTDDTRTVKGRVDNIIGENLANKKRTGKVGSDSMLLNERQIRRLSQGNQELREYLIKISEAVSDQVFESTQNTYNYRDVQSLFIDQAADMYSRITADGAKGLRNYFLQNKENKFVFMYDGVEVVTGTASQKVALEMVIRTLGKKAALIAEGSFELPAGVSKQRAAIKTQEAASVAMLEFKKISYMMGSEFAKLGIGKEGKRANLLPKDVKAKIQKDLKQIEIDEKIYNDEITRLLEANEPQMIKDLQELFWYTNGDVKTMSDLTEFLKANLTGGRFKGKNVRARWRTEAATAMYNSILSGPATPARAVFGTNFIGILRPFQEYLGGMVTGSKKDMVIATAQINALGEAWAEGLKLFAHNWDQGLAKRPQSYQGKFDLEKDAVEWKRLYEFNQRYGSDNEKAAYGIVNWAVDFNQSPWLKYPQIIMGSGDAMARTIIGRYQMRLQAAVDAIESGVDLDDVVAVAAKQDDIFRNKIFSKNKFDQWVVRDKAAMMAGDETALTTPLRGTLEGLDKLRNITGMRFFFPFVRTGVNALDLTFQHSPLAVFHNKWKDVMAGDPQLLLKKYGIREQDISQAQALMKGRLASGTMLMGLGGIMAMSGKMTGTLPQDKETRDLWKMRGVKPMSFKIGDTYISYANIEPFNTLLAATANVVSYQHVLGEDLRDDMLEKLRFMFTAVLVDKSMLAGVGDLAEVFSGNTSQEQLLRITAKLGRAQFFPYAGLSRQLGDIIDANEKEAEGFWQTIFRRDAVAKSFLPKKYDILSKDRSGKEFYPDNTNPLMRLFNSISPFPINWSDGDKVKENLRLMQYNLPEVMRQWKGVDLTSAETSQLQKILSQSSLRKRLELLMRSGGKWEKDLNTYRSLGLSSRAGYKLRDQEFYRDVHKIFMEEKKKALTILRIQNPDLYSRVQEREFKKGQSRYGNYDTIQKLLALPK